MDIIEKRIPHELIVYTLSFLSPEDIAKTIRATKCTFDDAMIQEYFKDFYSLHKSFMYLNLNLLKPSTAFMCVYLPKHRCAICNMCIWKNKMSVSMCTSCLSMYKSKKVSLKRKKIILRRGRGRYRKIRLLVEALAN